MGKTLGGEGYNVKGLELDQPTPASILVNAYTVATPRLSDGSDLASRRPTWRAPAASGRWKAPTARPACFPTTVAATSACDPAGRSSGPTETTCWIDTPRNGSKAAPMPGKVRRSVH